MQHRDLGAKVFQSTVHNTLRKKYTFHAKMRFSDLALPMLQISVKFLHMLATLAVVPACFITNILQMRPVKYMTYIAQKL